METVNELAAIEDALEDELQDEIEIELASAMNRSEILIAEIKHVTKLLRRVTRDESHYQYRQVLGFIQYAVAQLDDAINLDELRDMPLDDGDPRPPYVLQTLPIIVS